MKKSFSVLLASTFLATSAWADESSPPDAALKVTVSPSKRALRENIEGYIGDLGPRDVQALERYRGTAERLARQAAQALGYYQTNIISEVTPTDPPLLTLYVHRGEPVLLDDVVIKVEGEAALQESFKIPQSDELASGAQLNHGTYESAKSAIQSQASRYGYFQGKFVEHTLLIDPDLGIADIALIYDSGPRYRFGDITFDTTTPLDDALLRRMVPFEPYSEYDAEHIAELYNALQSSGYFRSVRIDAEPGASADQTVPLYVDLDMRLPRSLNFGVGMSTDVGPRLRAAWTKHWANRYGHSYGYEAELSAPRQNVGLFYDMPGKKPLTDKLRYAAGYQYAEIADTDSLSRLLTVGPEWHYRLPNKWQRVLSLKWQHESYRLGDDTGTSTLLLPGVSYSILETDNKLDPSEGYRLAFEVRGAKSGVLSDADIIHSSVTAKGLKTFKEEHRVLARLQVGANISKGYSNVPPSLRFFAGGDQSVRGYDYQALSPRNNRDERIGGRYMLAGSLEYQYEFKEKWRAAAFIDKGGAFNGLNLPALKTGVGVGLRWVSPIGPLRVDLANGLDEDGGFRVHFSMGPEL